MPIRIVSMREDEQKRNLHRFYLCCIPSSSLSQWEVITINTQFSKKNLMHSEMVLLKMKKSLLCARRMLNKLIRILIENVC